MNPQGTYNPQQTDGGNLNQAAPSSGVFWFGQDGNVWVKGSRGTNSAGQADANSYNYWTNLGFNQIADPNPGGQTPGAYTTWGGGVGGVGGSRAATATLDQIRETYQPLFGFYDQQLGSLAGKQEQNQNQISGQYNTQKQNLQTQTGQSKENIKTNQSNALRDLETNLRQAFQAGQIRLGNAGAGDSSAVGQYSYALSRLSNQNRGDIQRQSNQLNTEVDNTFTNAIGQLDLWKQTQFDSIAQQYQSLRDSLEEKKAGLTSQQIADITNAQVSLAQNALNAIQNTQGTYDNALKNFTVNNDGALSVGNAASQGISSIGQASSGLVPLARLQGSSPQIQGSSPQLQQQSLYPLQGNKNKFGSILQPF